MQPIKATIKPGDSGPAVSGLQDALLALLARQIIGAFDAPNRPTRDELTQLANAIGQDRALSQPGTATWQLVRYLQAQQGLGDGLHGVVEETTAAKINALLKSIGALDAGTDGERIVRGSVTGAQAGWIARAFDCDFRGQQLLGESPIDGGYLIRYRAAQAAQGESGSADIRVTVVDAAGKELVSSDIKYNAQADVTIDLAVEPVADGVSEYERYQKMLEPVLAGVPIGEIDGEAEEQRERDLDFLAGDTGIPRPHIAWLSRAAAFEALARHGTDGATDPEPRGHIAAAVFYGWFREGMPDSWAALSEQPIAALRAALRRAIAEHIVPASSADGVDSVLLAIPNPRRDAVQALGAVAGVPEKTLTTLLQHVSTLSELNNGVTKRLVADGALSAADAHALGLTVTLHGLLAGRLDAVTAVQALRSSRIPGGALHKARDLAALTGADVRAALEKGRVQPGTGASLDDLAQRVVQGIAAAFPTDVLLYRATDEPPDLEAALARLSPVLAANPKALTTDFASLDIESASDAERAALEESHQRLRELVNLHPGLGLATLLQSAATPADAITAAQERVGWIADMHTRNPDLDLLAIDYLPESKSLGQVNFGDLSADARAMVIGTLKAYQRVQGVTGDAIVSLALLQAGYHSSVGIVRSQPEELAARAKLSMPQATATYAAAQQRANDAAIAFVALHDAARDQHQLSNQLTPGVPAALVTLAGYSDLFGPLDFCDCEHCQSVLSPAAYFVDLMRYAEKNILGPAFKSHGGENNEIHLRSRRPDLWTLELTCENTEQYVPYLDIVNRVLETFIKAKLPAASASLYESLAASDASIRQPFMWPMERLTTLLSHFEVDRYDVARLFVLGDAAAEVAKRARCRLGLSAKEYDLIVGGRLGAPPTTGSLGAAGSYFDLLMGPMGFTTIVANVETQYANTIPIGALGAAMGLPRDVLRLLLASDFVNGPATDAAHRIVIQAGITAPGGVQNDTEIVAQLTIARVDRIERFVRLWRHLPWNVVELEYVLMRLQGAPPVGVTPAPAPTIDPTTLAALVQLLDMQKRWSLPVDELCALWNALPAKGLRNDTSLFDRAYNQPVFVKAPQDLFPQAATRFAFPELPATAGTPSPHARLLAALELGDADLAQLLAGLDPGNAGLLLTSDNLALLYRHARLARLLGISIVELFQTVALVATLGSAVTSLAGLGALLVFHDWRVASGFSLEETAYVTGGSASLDAIASPDDVAAAIVAAVATDDPLALSDTVFTTIGLTEEQSRRVVADNLSSVATDGLPLERVPASQGYQLRVPWDPDDPAAPFVFAPVASDAMVAAAARAAYDLASAAGPAGFAKDLYTATGMTAARSTAFVDANIHAGTDGKPFEAAGAAGRYRVRSDLTPDAAIQQMLTDATSRPLLQAATTESLTQQARALLARHHPFRVIVTRTAAALLTDPERVRAMVELVKPSPASLAQQYIAAACLSLQGHSQQPLLTLLRPVARLVVLFKSSVFDVPTLRFVATARDAFALPARPTNLTTSLVLSTDAVRRAASYAALAAAPDLAFDPLAAPTDVQALWRVLSSGPTLAAANGGDLALALRADAPRVGALMLRLQNRLATGLDGLTQLARALSLASRLGASADTLALAVSDDFAELTRAADGIYGVFRAAYADEKTFDEKLEPFADLLRARQRDGLVEFLIHPPVTATGLSGRFDTSDDLYDYFLIDVMLGGCARTSEVVAAISTVQLYVHRVLMNLERSKDGTVVAALVDPVRQEWKWRQHYRLWEANRRIFLFPESYIEPGSRDDKTPLFEALESTLLQTPVTDQDVLDAYAEYLHGFDEIARLRIAGVYHDRPAGGDDALHLFGVTANEPPAYYYRVIENIESVKPTRLGPWQKINLQIPVRRVSPIVFAGRLYVFWVETSTRAITSFKDGSSEFTGYRHSMRTKVSQLRLDGQWTPAQTLRVLDKTGAPAEARLIEDELIPIHEEVMDRNDQVVWGPYDVNQLTTAQGVQLTGYRMVNLASTSKMYFPHFTFRAEWDIRRREHSEPLENYTPEGWLWERAYPSPGPTALRLGVVPDTPAEVETPATLMVDFWAATVRTDPDTAVWIATADPVIVEPVTGGLNLCLSSTTATSSAKMPFYDATRQLNDLTLFADPAGPLIAASGPLLRVPDGTELQVVNGNEGNLVIDTLGEPLLWRSQPATGPCQLWRLGTTLAGVLGEKLAIDGIPGLLNSWWQNHQLVEAGLGIAVLDNTIDVTSRVAVDPITKQSALVGYYREVFFQIPFLIADYLNSQQQFEAAQQWYHYLFDPTARDDPATTEQVRPWRYREFRKVAAANAYETFREILVDQEQLDAYKQDPFSPHAIARLRPGAYQKAIVMKYIDNLLDWGDSLFAQFTMESVNEATMLYVMASDILGRRPVEAGPCGGAVGKPITYASIATKLDDGTESDFLLEELELLSIPTHDGQLHGDYVVTGTVPRYATSQQAATASFGAPAGGGAPPMPVGVGGGGGGGVGGVVGGGPPQLGGFGVANPLGWNKPGVTLWSNTKGTPLADLYGGGTVDGTQPFTVVGNGAPSLPLPGDPLEPPTKVPGLGGFGGSIKDVQQAGRLDPLDIGYGSKPPLQDLPPQQQFTPPAKPWDLVNAKLVFCFPENRDFLAYWDRVEDRLNKIRNCMDIAGVRRQLELFAPEIDPRLLVRMRAAGLSLDDVLNATSGAAPPYRFQYLIDKAKQHASLVQAFGGQLLSALEKRDVEELTQLRTVHEQNLLKLRQKAMQLEIDAAEDTLESLRRQQTAVEFRRDHYATLLQTGLSGFERVQQIGTHIASGLHELEATVQIVSAALHLVPQLGAPTAIVYGGMQLGETAARFGYASQALAEASLAAATSASLEAGFQRRGEEWQLQLDLAKHELNQVEKQITAAEIRRDIATESKTAHDRSIDQSQEIFDLLRDKFSSLGRYTFLSTELQRLNRLAFNAALSIARMAERAYRFERPDEDPSTLLGDGYWDAGNAGLLAGDRLVLDLQQLERKYIETNRRTLELEQSLSLMQIAPSALLSLREKGSCTFRVPESALDVIYPGHYRRRIKAVQLSIPCVTGPYLNVGATLQLTGSRVRQRTEATATLTEIPLGYTSTIATSSAQNDAGVFEFSFRDERFLPFEGAGAVSDWQLDLPSAFRAFDYRTISDVILRISYLAEQDPDLRVRVEKVTAPSEAGSLRKQLEVDGLPLLFSLRSDFPDAWRMLVTSAAGTIVPIELGDRQLPAIMANWLRGGGAARTLAFTPTSVAFVTQGAAMGARPTATLAAGLGAAAVPSVLTIDPTVSGDGLYHATLSGKATLDATSPKATLRLRIDGAGNFTPAAGVTGIIIDEAKLRDVMLLASVKITP